MKSILFVDDEPKVLAGLRRMLRSLRREWDMEFVQSGQEALERLAAHPCDVVVTDMRMPVMDGSQLLHEVTRRHPATVRIILSGQCDRQAVLKAVGPTHQFLTKPCDSEMLKSTVARACALRDRLPDDRLKQVVTCVQSIPSRPAAHAQLVAELESPATSVQRLGEIIARDVGMAAKIIQLVNSGFFGTPQRVSDVAHAANLLGLDTIRALVLSTDAFSPFGSSHSANRSLEALHDHSLAVATAAREIAAAETGDATLIADAYLAGLLHDIGILVLASQSDQDDVGAYLMELWGAPEPIVKAIAFHSRPSSSPDRAFSPLAAVHVAGALLEEEPDGAAGATARIDMDYLERIGCVGRMDAWREICRANRLEGAAS